MVFNVIFSMDSLSKYKAYTDYLKKNITLRGPMVMEILHRGNPRESGVRLISAIRT